MSGPNLVLLHQQVRRVNRRLFTQTLVNRLVWCVSGALVASVLWFLVQPFVLETAAPWLRWAVAGGLVAASAVLAAGLAWWAAPSRLDSALSLDERFGLKERVTTTLSLTAEQQQSAAGQALLDDVKQRVSGLDVRSKFPIQFGWVASLVPVAAALLALVAVFYEPPKSTAKTRPEDELKKAPANKVEIDQKMAELRKRKAVEPGEKPKSEKLKEIEAEMERIANRPRDTREAVRERMKEMTALEDKIRDRQKETADKARALKSQLRELNRQSEKNNQEGPAKDLHKALSEGNIEKAKDEVEKLAKKLERGELSDKEKEELKKQLDGLKDKLERAANKKDEEEKLRQKFEKGEINAETLERELDRLKQESEKLKDLEKLAQKLGNCKDCLEKGNAGDAAKQLQAAADELKNMDLSDKEMKELQEQMQKLQDAKNACSQCNKDGDGAGSKDGDGKGQLQGQGNGFAEGKGPGQQGAVNGKRPLGKDKKSNTFDARQPVEFDPKGKKLFDGFAPGQNYKAKGGPEVAGDVLQASQEAPEAIEAQKIPKAARDMAKGYFRNLGGQYDKEKKPAAKE